MREKRKYFKSFFLAYIKLQLCKFLLIKHQYVFFLNFCIVNVNGVWLEHFKDIIFCCM